MPLVWVTVGIAVLLVLVLAFGAMLNKLLEESGAAHVVVRRLTERSPDGHAPNRHPPNPNPVERIS